MPRKLIPLPKPSGSLEAPLLSKRRDTVVFSIGGRRYAFDFVTTVRELRSEPAHVIPFGSLAGDRRGQNRLKRSPQFVPRIARTFRCDTRSWSRVHNGRVDLAVELQKIYDSEINLRI